MYFFFLFLRIQGHAGPPRGLGASLKGPSVTSSSRTPCPSRKMPVGCHRDKIKQSQRRFVNMFPSALPNVSAEWPTGTCHAQIPGALFVLHVKGFIHLKDLAPHHSTTTAGGHLHFVVMKGSAGTSAWCLSPPFEAAGAEVRMFNSTDLKMSAESHSISCASVSVDNNDQTTH